MSEINIKPIIKVGSSYNEFTVDESSDNLLGKLGLPHMVISENDRFEALVEYTKDIYKELDIQDTPDIDEIKSSLVTDGDNIKFTTNGKEQVIKKIPLGFGVPRTHGLTSKQAIGLDYQIYNNYRAVFLNEQSQDNNTNYDNEFCLLETSVLDYVDVYNGSEDIYGFETYIKDHFRRPSRLHYQLAQAGIDPYQVYVTINRKLSNGDPVTEEYLNLKMGESEHSVEYTLSLRIKDDINGNFYSDPTGTLKVKSVTALNELFNAYLGGYYHMFEIYPTSKDYPLKRWNRYHKNQYPSYPFSSTKVDKFKPYIGYYLPIPYTTEKHDNLSREDALTGDDNNVYLGHYFFEEVLSGSHIKNKFTEGFDLADKNTSIGDNIKVITGINDNHVVNNSSSETISFKNFNKENDIKNQVYLYNNVRLDILKWSLSSINSDSIPVGELSYYSHPRGMRLEDRNFRVRGLKREGDFDFSGEVKDLPKYKCVFTPLGDLGLGDLYNYSDDNWYSYEHYKLSNSNLDSDLNDDKSYRHCKETTGSRLFGYTNKRTIKAFFKTINFKLVEDTNLEDWSNKNTSEPTNDPWLGYKEATQDRSGKVYLEVVTLGLKGYVNKTLNDYTYSVYDEENTGVVYPYTDVNYSDYWLPWDGFDPETNESMALSHNPNYKDRVYALDKGKVKIKSGILSEASNEYTHGYYGYNKSFSLKAPTFDITSDNIKKFVIKMAGLANDDITNVEVTEVTQGEEYNISLVNNTQWHGKDNPIKLFIIPPVDVTTYGNDNKTPDDKPDEWIIVEYPDHGSLPYSSVEPMLTAFNDNIDNKQSLDTYIVLRGSPYEYLPGYSYSNGLFDHNTLDPVVDTQGVSYKTSYSHGKKYNILTGINRKFSKEVNPNNNHTSEDRKHYFDNFLGDYLTNYIDNSARYVGLPRLRTNNEIPGDFYNSKENVNYLHGDEITSVYSGVYSPDYVEGFEEEAMVIAIPSNITTIKSGAFKYTFTRLLIIPPSLTTIESGAFKHSIDNNLLERVYIDNSDTVERVKGILANAGYSNLDQVTFKKITLI